MNNEPKIIVPASTEVLVLPKDHSNLLDVSSNLENMSILGKDLQYNLDKTQTLKKGIHLLWSLPKALKHGFTNDRGALTFPTVPNRWMVTRVQTNSPNLQKIPTKMWLVKSDVIINDEDSPNWVEMVEVNKQRQFEFKQIGKKVEWAKNYEEKSEAAINLTAVGAINPLFSAVYAECKNSFGFYDDMSGIDLDTGHTFSYIITGWYSNPLKDPLNASFPEKEVQERIKKLWLCTTAHPKSTLIHSTIQNVVWKTDITSGVPDSNVNIFVGNTATEALSALIAKTKKNTLGSSSSLINENSVEDLLNALQYQLLEDTTKQPNLDTIKNENHKKGFVSKNRNFIWEIKKFEDTSQQLEDNKEQKLQFPNNPELLEKLKTLNQKQIAYNVNEENLHSLQQEYYFVWNKEVIFHQNLDQNQQATYNAIKISLLAYKKDLETKIAKEKRDQENLKTNILTLIKSIEDYNIISSSNSAPGTTKESAIYDLVKKVEDRFWEPNDPTILFSGDGIYGNKRKQNQSFDEKIQCRTLNEVINGFYLNVPTENNPIPVQITKNIFEPKIDLSSITNNNIPYTTIKTLIYETLLLNLKFANRIALKAYTLADLGEGKDVDSKIIQTFANKIVKPIQQGNVKPTYIAKGAMYPEKFSITEWQQAWQPLFMVWKATYTPYNKTIKDFSIPFEFTPNSPNEHNTKLACSGMSPLSNAAFKTLETVVSKNKVQEFNTVIAQTLSGFNKFLLTQVPCTQLPPLKFTIDEDGELNSDNIIDDAFLELINNNSDAYSLGCSPGEITTNNNNFSPLRYGTITINKLSIIDAFGQEKKVIMPQGTNELNLSKPISNGKSKLLNYIPLAPRIIQPSRLQFNWLNSDDKIIHQDAGLLDNPIIGWLIPNYLDKQIMVYDGLGNEVMILQITSDVTATQGLGIQKKPFPGSNNFQNQGKNTHLKSLLENIKAGLHIDGILELAKLVNENLLERNPLENNTSALFYGQPIAVARCQIGIELLGNSYCNQQWKETGKKNSGVIETLKTPLYIGDFKTKNDGLIGYYADENYSKLQVTNNIAKFEKFSPYFKKQEPLLVLPNDTAKKITVLLNAGLGLHLTTPILPTKLVELYSYTTKKTLESINNSFMIAPFLADKVAPGVPTPMSMNTRWKWIHKSDVNTWESSNNTLEGKNKQEFTFKKQQVYEGWIRLSNLKNK